MTSARLINNTQGNDDSGIIDLGIGHPQDKLLPLQLLQRAVQARFRTGDPYFLQYGSRQGDGYLRMALAEFLSMQYQMTVDPDGLFITNGASMGLALTCSLFSQPGDTILVEEPTYFLALKIFEDFHLKPVSIPIDENGMNLEFLQKALKIHQPSLLYTIPTFQNPSGITLTEERRLQLATISQEYNFLIVADEVYHFLNYTIPSPKPMASYIDHGNILSLGSFSKILAPGLRTGWIQTDKERIQVIKESGLLDSGGGMNPFSSAILRSVLEDGDLLSNITKLRQIYTARVSALDKSLKRYLPEARYKTPQGGYFFWVRMDGIANTGDYLIKAKDKNQVLYNPGNRFSSRAGLQDYIRLCFAYYEESELEEGVRRLRKLFSTI